MLCHAQVSAWENRPGMTCASPPFTTVLVACATVLEVSGPVSQRQFFQKKASFRSGYSRKGSAQFCARLLFESKLLLNAWPEKNSRKHAPSMPRPHNTNKANISLSVRRHPFRQRPHRSRAEGLRHSEKSSGVSPPSEPVFAGELCFRAMSGLASGVGFTRKQQSAMLKTTLTYSPLKSTVRSCVSLMSISL